MKQPKQKKAWTDGMFKIGPMDEIIDRVLDLAVKRRIEADRKRSKRIANPMRAAYILQSKRNRAREHFVKVLKKAIASKADEEERSIRQRAPDTGGRAFHFQIYSVSKSAGAPQKFDGQKKGKVDGPGRAAAHQAYLERPDAVEKTGIVPSEKLYVLGIDDGNGYERDLNEPGAAAAVQRYIENPEKITSGGAVTSFGTLGQTEAERLQFWDMVEAFEPQKNSRIQNRIILELPHDTTPDQRHRILENYTQLFQSLSLPYHWCIHAPTAENDSRNYHAHIVFSERPAIQIINPETGQIQWDFTIGKKVRHSSRHYSITYPYRQKRLRGYLKDRDFIKKERARFAAIVNEVMRKTEYDARSYKAMGLDVKPIKSVNRIMAGRLGAKRIDIDEPGWKRKDIDALLERAARRRDQDVQALLELNMKLRELTRGPVDSFRTVRLFKTIGIEGIDEKHELTRYDLKTFALHRLANEHALMQAKLIGRSLKWVGEAIKAIIHQTNADDKPVKRTLAELESAAAEEISPIQKRVERYETKFRGEILRLKGRLERQAMAPLRANLEPDRQAQCTAVQARSLAEEAKYYHDLFTKTRLPVEIVLSPYRDQIERLRAQAADPAFVGPRLDPVRFEQAAMVSSGRNIGSVFGGLNLVQKANAAIDALFDQAAARSLQGEEFSAFVGAFVSKFIPASSELFQLNREAKPAPPAPANYQKIISPEVSHLPAGNESEKANPLPVEPDGLSHSGKAAVAAPARAEDQPDPRSYASPVPVREAISKNDESEEVQSPSIEIGRAQHNEMRKISSQEAPSAPSGCAPSAVDGLSSSPPSYSKPPEPGHKQEAIKVPGSQSQSQPWPFSFPLLGRRLRQEQKPPSSSPAKSETHLPLKQQHANRAGQEKSKEPSEPGQKVTREITTEIYGARPSAPNAGLTASSVQDDVKQNQGETEQPLSSDTSSVETTAAKKAKKKRRIFIARQELNLSEPVEGAIARLLREVPEAFEEYIKQNLSKECIGPPGRTGLEAISTLQRQPPRNTYRSLVIDERKVPKTLQHLLDDAAKISDQRLNTNLKKIAAAKNANKGRGR